MDFLDRLSLSPADSTLVQSEAILFAAALFVGCTLFDAQSANARLDEAVASVATAVRQALAPAPGPTTASADASPAR